MYRLPEVIKHRSNIYWRAGGSGKNVLLRYARLNDEYLETIQKKNNHGWYLRWCSCARAPHRGTRVLKKRNRKQNNYEDLTTDVAYEEVSIISQNEKQPATKIIVQLLDVSTQSKDKTEFGEKKQVSVPRCKAEANRR